MQTFGLFGSILLPASSSRGIRRFVCSEFCSLQPVVLLDFWSVFWIAYVATFCNYSRYRVRTRYVTYIRIEVGEQPICMKFLPKSQQFVVQAWRVRGPAWHQSRGWFPPLGIMETHGKGVPAWEEQMAGNVFSLNILISWEPVRCLKHIESDFDSSHNCWSPFFPSQRCWIQRYMGPTSSEPWNEKEKR